MNKMKEKPKNVCGFVVGSFDLQFMFLLVVSFSGRGKHLRNLRSHAHLHMHARHSSNE